MITKEQAYNTISDLNERAHSITWDQWEEAAEDEELRDFDYRKFAELIVRECADVANGLAAPTVALRIKERFGIE